MSQACSRLCLKYAIYELLWNTLNIILYHNRKHWSNILILTIIINDCNNHFRTRIDEGIIIGSNQLNSKGLILFTGQVVVDYFDFNNLIALLLEKHDIWKTLHSSSAKKLFLVFVEMFLYCWTHLWHIYQLIYSNVVLSFSCSVVDGDESLKLNRVTFIITFDFGYLDLDTSLVFINIVINGMQPEYSWLKENGWPSNTAFTDVLNSPLINCHLYY